MAAPQPRRPSPDTPSSYARGHGMEPAVQDLGDDRRRLPAEATHVCLFNMEFLQGKQTIRQSRECGNHFTLLRETRGGHRLGPSPFGRSPGME